MKIYTRRGDAGETDLFAGGRVGKDDLRVEAYGTVDELNAALGLSRALLPAGEAELQPMLARIQDELFTLGAELATPDAAKARERVAQADIDAMEKDIDLLEAGNAPLRQFVLPAGTSGASALHLARTVCRRAERLAVTLARKQTLRGEIVTYLNRLSDLLFVMARAANRKAGVPDVPWDAAEQAVKRAVARAAALQEGAIARFAVERRGFGMPALALWAEGAPRAYLDVCAHRGQPLDEITPAGQAHCGAHGATYDPASGKCVDGPCVGASLSALECGVEDGTVWVDDEEPYDDTY